MPKSRKRAPNVADPQVNRVIQDIYKEINSINDRALSPYGIAPLQPSEGQPGDIRLYEDIKPDGGTSYFLQGKFKDAWASVNLGLQSISINNTSFEESQSLEDSTAFITLNEAKALVNFSNLNANLSVGTGSAQVAPGDHDHDHDGDSITGTGDYTHAKIDNHLEAGIAEPNNAIDAEVHSVSGSVDSDVSLTATSAGSAGSWARSDHRHKLNEAIVPTWTGLHTHSAKVVIDVGAGNDALDVTGDTIFDGDVSITYSEAQANAATLSNHVTLNADDGGTDTLSTYTTTIYGATTIGPGTGIDDADGLIVNANSALNGKVKISTQLSPNLELLYGTTPEKYSRLTTDTGGNLLVQSSGNIQLSPNNEQVDGVDVEGSVLPKGTRITDLGSFNRLWRTGYFSEIYAETLVAQDVMSTIGGRIIVAPTSIIEEKLETDSTSLKLRHNNFFPGDYALLKAAPAGLPTFEVLQIIDGPTYTTIGTVISTVLELESDSDYQEATSGSMRNLYPERNLQILITTSSAHGLDDGDFVIVAGTGGNPIDGLGYDGAYKVAYLDVTSSPSITSGACLTTQFALSAPFVSGNTFGGNVKGPPFTYTVRRNIDDNEASQWHVGDAITNIGYKAGDGYLELTSTETLQNQLGPQLAIFSRTGTNLITNPGFDGNSTSWTLSAGATHNTDTDDVYTGSGSIKMSRSLGSADITMMQTLDHVFAVDDEIVIEAWVKKTTLGASYISITDGTGNADFYLADTSTEMHSDNTFVLVDGDNWQRVSWIGKCHSISGSTDLRLVFHHGVESNATYNLVGTIYIDNISVYVNPSWNGAKPTVALGNLNSYVDYSADNADYFGLALGNDLTKSPSDSSSPFKGLTSDSTNGLRLFNTDIAMYNAGERKSVLFADGTIKLGNQVGETSGTTEATSFHFIPSYDHDDGNPASPALFLNTGVYFGTTPLGECILVDRGDFDETYFVDLDDSGDLTAGDIGYVVGDLVQRIVGGVNSQYRCILDTGAPDSTHTAPESDTTHWNLLVADGAQGASGAAGSAGSNAHPLSVVASHYGTQYNSDGETPSPSTTTFTATLSNLAEWEADNLGEDDDIYYQFLDSVGTEIQNTTTPTYSYTFPDPKTYDSVTFTVKARANTLGGTVISSDTISLFALQQSADGADGATGAQGDPGPQGETGDVGPAGASGVANMMPLEYAAFDDTSLTYNDDGNGFALANAPYDNLTSFTRNTVSYLFGDASLRLVGDGTNDMYRLYFGDNFGHYNLDLPPGRKWVFSWYARNTHDSAIDVSIWLSGFGVRDEEGSAPYDSWTKVDKTINYNSDNWARYSVNFDFTSSGVSSNGVTGGYVDATKFLFRFDNNTNAHQESLYLDGFMIEEDSGSGTATTWHRPSTPIGTWQSLNALAAPATGSGLFLDGAGEKFGFYDTSEWKTYMDNTGQFFLTGSNGDGLSWNPSSDSLVINGSINLKSTASTNGSGTLQIPSIDGSAIYTESKIAYVNDTAGFWLGNDGGTFKLNLGDADTSIKWDGGDLLLKGANIEIDNADVDVFIGEDIADKGASSQDDIMIGTWDSQAGSSGSGHGVLVKTDTIRDPDAGDAVGSGKYDYIKLYKGGFNRSGYDFPIHIYSGIHGGWVGNQADSVNNGATPVHTYGGGMNLRTQINGYGFPTNYTSVPVGRKLLFTTTTYFTSPGNSGSLWGAKKYWNTNLHNIDNYHYNFIHNCPNWEGANPDILGDNPYLPHYYNVKGIYNHIAANSPANPGGSAFFGVIPGGTDLTNLFYISAPVHGDDTNFHSFYLDLINFTEVAE